MIDLFNRRFVSFYFNRSGHGEGGDAGATAFVDGQTENPYAYLAAFSPKGEILGETELYADKDAVFEWAVKLLEENPQYAWETDAEQGIWSAADSGSPGDLLAAAQLDEGLGRYRRARATLERVLAGESSVLAVEAGLVLLRVERFAKDWPAHASVEQRILADHELTAQARIDLDLERGRRWLGEERFAEARPWLQDLTRRANGHPRLAEAHFYAGVACWFTDDRSWAKFHWGYVGENLRRDRLWRRAYIAAAAEAMPYPNAELDGYKAPVGNIGVGHIIRGYESAVRVYEGLLPLYEAGQNTGEASGTGFSHDGPGKGPVSDLVGRLRDGNEHVAANNIVVDELVELGLPAVEPLMAALADRAFAGRGYAAWALAKVLAPLEDRPEAALAALRSAQGDSDSYVALLSTSGVGYLGRYTSVVTSASTLSTRSPFLLVASLRDGNDHRIANNEVVDRLEEIGSPSIAILLVALEDDAFPGRGYAAWGLSQVLKATGAREERALEALRSAAEDEDPYVATLAASGLSTL